MQINREQKTNRDYVRFKIAGPPRPPKALGNQELLSRTKFLVQKEREVHVQVLRHLREIESRKLYFSQGFSSLFDYAVRELGYSEGAAFRRIKAMRLCRDLPEAEERIQSGKLSLSSASQLQNFFEKQKKAQLKREKAVESVNRLESEKPPQRVLPQTSRRADPEESAQRFLAKTPKRIESENPAQSEESRSLENAGRFHESSRREEPAGLSCPAAQAGADSQESIRRKESLEAGLSCPKSQASAAFSVAFFGETGKEKEKKREEKEKTLNRSQKLDLIEKTEGRSSRFTEKLLLERAPEIFEKSAARRERARLLGNGRVEIKAIVSESCHKKLKELKNLLSHRNPSMGYGGLLEILSDLALDKFDPIRKEERKKQTKGGQALNSGGSRKNEEGGGERRPDGRDESRDASPAPASRLPGASGSKIESRFFVASAQKSQQARQTSVATGGKSWQTNRTFAASAQKLRLTERTFTTSAQKSPSAGLHAKRASVTSAQKLKSTPQAAVDWAAPIAKSQKTQQIFALTGNKGQQTKPAGDTSSSPGASGSKSISRIFAASAPKSQKTSQVFATSASKQDHTTQTPDDSILKQSQAAPDPATSAQKSQGTRRNSVLVSDKRRQMNRTFAASAQKSGQATRYIPAEVKRRVWIRDKGCCSYLNPRTGQKCGSRRFLHIDHILPFALGGGSGADNLRLLCSGHNQFRARQTFKSAARENNSL